MVAITESRKRGYPCLAGQIRLFAAKAITILILFIALFNRFVLAMLLRATLLFVALSMACDDTGTWARRGVHKRMLSNTLFPHTAVHRPELLIPVAEIISNERNAIRCLDPFEEHAAKVFC
ncbi:hypothetical protein Tco_0232692 [Tanacetum coccineum]